MGSSKVSIRNYLKTIGKRGGQKTAKRGKEYYSLIGKKGLAKRWKDKSEITLNKI